jgi:hypothetical protein
LYWWHVRIWLGVREQLSEKQNSKKKLFFNVHVASVSKQFCYPIASNMLSNREISNSNLSSFKRLRFMKVIIYWFYSTNHSQALLNLFRCDWSIRWLNVQGGYIGVQWGYVGVQKGYIWFRGVISGSVGLCCFYTSCWPASLQSRVGGKN